MSIPIMDLMNKFYKKKSKVRSYMRSYNLLAKQNKLDYITNIRNLLANRPTTNNNLKILFNSNEDICLHQFLVHRLLNFNFNKSILLAISDPKKKLFYPLPLVWRKILHEQGFQTLHTQNSLLWIYFNLKWYLIGVLTLILELTRFNVNSKISRDTFVYFNNLYPGNLKKNSYSENILSWFCKQEESIKIDEINHSCKENLSFNIKDKRVKYIKSPIPPFYSINNFLFFFLWGLFKSITVLFNSKKRLLFRELIFKKKFVLTKDKYIHSVYFFHNSGHLFRPLWTYEVEKRCSRIVFYFYSTNNYSFKLKNKKHIQNNQWQIVNWPEYWIWNELHYDFLKKFVLSKYRIKIKGNIPFLSSEIDINFLKKQNYNRHILVFDVQPYRPSVYSSISQTVDYYNERNCLEFLNYIHIVAKKLSLKVLIKRKRDNKNISKKYLNHLKNYTTNLGWEQIDPEIDPSSLLKVLSPLCTINMPYTSTAFISKEMGIPALYLDPTGCLDKSFLKSSRIPLVNNEDDLFKWVKEIIVSNKILFNEQRSL